MKRTFTLLVLIAALLMGWRLWSRSTTEETPGIAALHARSGRPVRVVKPARRDLRETVTLTGQLEPLARVPAQFDIDGRLLEVLAKVGERVQEGQTLARLDSSEQSLVVEAARAARDHARAALQKAEAGPRAQELESARAARAEARAAFEVAREELARSRRLQEQRAASQRQLDQSQGNYEVAEARLARAREQLALLEEGTRAEDLAMARAALAQAEAQLARARLLLAKHVLHAPFSGVVVAAPVEPGEVVKSMPEPRKIMILETQDPILFVSDVSELFLPELSARTTLEVTVDALPGRRFPARVHEISPSGDAASRTFRVEFALDNSELALRPAMFGRSRLVLEEIEDATTVPSYVLREPETLELLDGAPPAVRPEPIPAGRPGERALVMVAADGLAAARLVRVALIAGEHAALAEGLREGDRVITEGFEEIPAGMKVRVLEDRDGGSARGGGAARPEGSTGAGPGGGER